VRDRWVAKLALTVLLALVLAGCGANGDDHAAGGTPSASTSGPTFTNQPSESPTSSTSPSPVLGDGRHPTYLKHVDVPNRTVTFDLIQFLTGDEAKKAYVKDHPEDPGGSPNDYYIINENPRLRTLPVVAGVEVTVLWLGGGAQPEKISFEELPEYLASKAQGPFWLTVDDGDVFEIEEQFIP
jgi:hypothetical protein